LLSAPPSIPRNSAGRLKGDFSSWRPAVLFTIVFAPHSMSSSPRPGLCQFCSVSPLADNSFPPDFHRPFSESYNHYRSMTSAVTIFFRTFSPFPYPFFLKAPRHGSPRTLPQPPRDNLLSRADTLINIVTDRLSASGLPNTDPPFPFRRPSPLLTLPSNPQFLLGFFPPPHIRRPRACPCVLLFP